MKVDVVLPASLFGKVKVGQKASVLSAQGATRYAANVKYLDRVIDAASGTFVARLELPNPNLLVPGGARCMAEIDGLAATNARP
jgi:multidrug efflux pump subunit AcrA (membrane-fusion protein)